MKNRFVKSLLLLIIPLFLFFFGINAKAIEVDVTDFKVANKNGSIEVDDPVFNNNKVISNITFNELNDYVTFEFNLLNREDNKYTITAISDDNENENILFEYNYDNNEFAKNEKAKVQIKLSYNNLLKNKDEKLDNVKIIITLTKSDGEEEDIVIPITGDSIHVNIILLIVAAIIFVYCLYELNISNKARYSLLVLMIMLVPSIIFAEEKYEVEIEFNNIVINGEYDYFNVIIDKDNGEEELVLSKKYGSKLEELTTPEKAGYTFVKWVDGNNNEVSSSTVVKSNYAIKAVYEANTNTAYKVLHYLQNINDDNYSIFDTENLTGTTDTMAIAIIKTGEGFVIDENNENNVVTGLINGNGTLELKLYYNRNTHDVTYSYTNDNLPSDIPVVPETVSYRYGANVVIEEEPVFTGYTFSGWSRTESFEMPDSDVSITGTWTPNTDTAYKVEHYYENADNDNYSLFKTDNLTGTTDTTVNATARTDEGFTFDSNNTNNITSGNIDRNGNLVLKLYYTRIKYEVSYSITGNVLSDYSPLPETKKYKYDQDVTVANDLTAQGYIFNGWDRTGTFKMPAENVTITGSFAVGTSSYTIEHYGQDVNGNYVLLESETEHRTGTTNSHITGAHKDIENHSFVDLNHTVYSYDPNHNGEVSEGIINPEGTLTLKFYYNRNKYELHIINETNVTGAASGKYFYGTELTLVANERDEDDEAFTKWNDGVTDTRTRNITITDDITIGPYYHIYTVTLVDEDPRTTVATQTEIEKVDPGSSIILPELTREECVYAKDAIHVTPEERECTFIAEFLGWYTDEEFTNKVESPYYPPDDITLYAKWNGVYYHYRVSGVREYSGTEGDYDDSGIILYNLENRNRDFDISFDLIEYDESPYQQPTILNGKFEKESLNYPGFVIRFNANNTNGWSRILVTSRWGTGGSDKVEHYINNANLWKDPPTADEPIHFKITRRDGVVTATYSTNYSGSSIPATGVTVNLFDQNSSHTPNLPDRTPTTVTFGASIDEQGIPMRFFKGKLANMEVVLTSHLYD